MSHVTDRLQAASQRCYYLNFNVMLIIRVMRKATADTNQVHMFQVQCNGENEENVFL